MFGRNLRRRKFRLSQEDKRDAARLIYGNTPLHLQGEKKKRLAEILSVTKRTVQEWLSRIDKDNRERRIAEVIQLWLACYTQEDLVSSIGMTQQAVSKVLQQMEGFRFVVKLGECADVKNEKDRLDEIERRNRAAANHAADFDPPIYNIVIGASLRCGWRAGRKRRLQRSWDTSSGPWRMF